MNNFNLEIIEYNKEYLIVSLIYNNNLYSNYRFYYKYKIPKKKKSNKITYTILILLMLFITSLTLTVSNFKLSNDYLYKIYYTSKDVSSNYRSNNCNQKTYGILLNYCSAIEFQKVGLYNDAIREFKIVIYDNNNLFVEQSEWYLALCYLKTDQTKNAYDQFKKISEKNGYYKSNAKKILKRIKK